MAVRLRFCCSRIFVVWLLLTIILDSQNLAIKIESEANLVYVSTELDVKLPLSRNSGLKFGNITFCAA